MGEVGQSGPFWVQRSGHRAKCSAKGKVSRASHLCVDVVYN